MKLQSVQNSVVLCDSTICGKNGFTVEAHVLMPRFVWTTARIELYVPEHQRLGIGGHQLRQELVGKNVLNAHVLDFLLAKPHMIPDAWIENPIAFWGTIYRAPEGYLGVRILCRREDCWESDYEWLDDRWGDDVLAAIHTS